MSVSAAIAPADIAKDAPLRLAVAAELAFPMGGMTAAGLRKEAARGNLAIERIAGKDYTTLGAIEAMRERCRKEASQLGSGSDPRGETRKPSGSSETEKNDIALAAAKLSMERLKRNSRNGSPKSTNLRERADVIRPTFRSPTP